MNSLIGFFYGIYRAAIPEPANRIHITWKTYPITISYLIPLSILAYLVRRPHTYRARMSLLPIVLLLAVHGGFGYMWAEPKLNTWNFFAGFSAMACSAKALELASVKDYRKNVSKIENEKSDDVATSRSERHLANSSATTRSKTIFLPSWFTDTIETFTSLRGIGWEFGKDIYVPPDTRSMEKKTFLKETVIQILINLAKIDVMSSFQVLLPSPGVLQGGSIFLPSLPPLSRYTLSTLIHLETGVQAIALLDITYDLLTLICVGIFDQSPSLWPPLFDKPWNSGSLHDFWGRRWHQTQRQLLTIVGGYPGQLLAGKIGFVMGTFIASGLYHEYAFYTVGRGWDNRMVLFFIYQGIGVVIERLWRDVTGRRVGGLFGTLWAYFCIAGLGQTFTDSLYARAIGGDPIFPADYSPTRRIIWPTVEYLTEFRFHWISGLISGQ